MLILAVYIFPYIPALLEQCNLDILQLLVENEVGGTFGSLETCRLSRLREGEC